MKLTFLGTGTSQGVPMIACTCTVCSSTDARDKRLRTAALIETDGTVICIDTGPDFRTQMLREKVKRIDAVVFTHNHKDHTAGLDDIRAFNYFQEKEMNVWGDALVLESLQVEFAYIFGEFQYPGIPRIQLNLIENDDFIINQQRITPIACMHYRLPIKGFRVGNITYITDANHIEDNEIDKIKGSEILVVNALRHEKHISHFTLNEAIELANKVGAKQTFFTHISHQLGTYASIQPTLPNGMYLAYDGLKIEI
jgi:phosphoribosyl 1,2-cyclic phosphate phosphodiesterase